MIESGYLKTTDECIKFTLGYQLGEESRTKLYECADFLSEERTFFRVRLFDYGKYAFAHLILVDEFGDEYFLFIDSNDKCITTSSSKMLYDILDYGTVDNYLNTIKGFIHRGDELVQSFEIDVRKWSREND